MRLTAKARLGHAPTQPVLDFPPFTGAEAWGNPGPARCLSRSRRQFSSIGNAKLPGAGSKIALNGEWQLVTSEVSPLTPSTQASERVIS
jgi:hypothetical protein